MSKSKIDHRGLEIELFPDCNLKCNFCFQRNIECFSKNRENVIKLPKSHYIKKCTETIQKYNLFTDSVELWGGELFYDNSLEYATQMIKFIKFLNPKLITLDTNLIWNIDNNLLFNYLNKRESGFVLYISYDPVNRYTNDKMLDLFKSNLKRLLNVYWSTRGDLKRRIEIQVLLQPEILKNEVDLSFLQEIYESRYFNITFYIDYRGYDEEITSNFHKYYFNIIKKFPRCRQIEQLFEEKVHDNNFCMCLQPDTVFLTYNNDFKYIKNASCIEHSDVSKVKPLLLDTYNCKSCKFYKNCKDVCATTLYKLGLLKPGIKCYKQYLYENYDDLNEKNLSNSSIR